MPITTQKSGARQVHADRSVPRLRPTGTRAAGAPERPRPRARDALAARPSEGLEAEVVELSHRLSAGTYELLVLIGELDHRGRWAAFGSLSCAAWLADTCDIEIATARSQVRVARAMRTFPALDAAMATGDVSYAKARALVPYLTADNASELLDIAVRTPAARLGAAVAAWSQRNDDVDTIAARQHAMRSVSWRTEPDGSVVITARLAPEAAAEVCAVVDAQVARADAPAGASLAQQRADALHTIATSGTSSSHSSNVTAEVLVHVTADGNHLTDGTPLSDHAVAALLPDAFVSLLLHDHERQPIDASPRRRFPTRRQRRVLDARQTECAHPGCHATVFLQYDHIDPYTRGGPTTLDNLRRLCGPHNRGRDDAPGHVAA
jgi:hypothetical protein